MLDFSLTSFGNFYEVIKYIHPNYLKLSTNLFISTAQSLDYESVINSLDFILSYPTSLLIFGKN